MSVKVVEVGIGVVTVSNNLVVEQVGEVKMMN